MEIFTLAGTISCRSNRKQQRGWYAYLQPELSEYDAWFNVKDDLLVLGVPVKDKGELNARRKNPK